MVRIRSVCLATALAPIFLGSTFAQNIAHASARTLIVDQPSDNDPIRIVKVMDGVTELMSNGRQYPNKHSWETVFEAGDDWIRDISFVIKNVSQKKIILLSTSAVLYGTGDVAGDVANRVPALGVAGNVLGHRPKHALYSATLGHAIKPDEDKRPPFELAPGQEVTMALEDPELYPALNSRIGSGVAGCNSSVVRVFFEDGTQWQSHSYFRPADQPGRYTRISFEEWSSGAKTGD
jgi:hypothetical protein